MRTSRLLLFTGILVLVPFLIRHSLNYSPLRRLIEQLGARMADGEYQDAQGPPAAAVPDPSNVSIRSLTCGDAFHQLTRQERLYAHHLSRAAWAGSAITQRQVSPESPHIVDLILELHRSCHGDWSQLNPSRDAKPMDRLLTYFAFILSNMGNYYGYGDQKFLTSVPGAFIASVVAKYTDRARSLQAERAYYTISDDSPTVTLNDVKSVDTLLADKGIAIENTLLHTIPGSQDKPHFQILQSSVETSDNIDEVGSLPSGARVTIRKGGFSAQLDTVCQSLRQALEYAASDNQRDMLRRYIQHFETGSMAKYEEAQISWLKDLQPKVEFFIGFVEQYRDPAGQRAEFEGLVAIHAPNASEKLSVLISSSREHIEKLPWVEPGGQNELGPFEAARIELPTFTAIQALAYSSTIIFTGINLPNSAAIRDAHGFKNVMIPNRNTPPDLNRTDLTKEAPFVASDEVAEYLRLEYYSSELRIAIHELIGHGTGNKLLREEADGTANFDLNNPPIDPTTNQPIRTWYKNGESDTKVFGGLGPTLNECRADGIGLYLLSEESILSIFGYDGSSELKAHDIIYNAYLAIAVHGLEALLSYDDSEKEWTQAHEHGFYIILRTLIAVPGLIHLDSNDNSQQLTVHVDRSKILTAGRKALGDLLLHLHIWRVTGDVEAFKAHLNDIAVDEYWLKIRSIVKARKLNSWMFIQSNTFIDEDGSDIEIKTYDETPEGMIQSWADRFPTG
ncbi:peptidase family M49 [Stachybotrys elegans]|uniref:Peptidase family M49 n=1 Tax=Stachybotrys elegans TaxID=80388 RepID=A0A8K0WPU2_9HYPO|nr:peptidase family M49 [Stachybotrys elegans]